MFRNKLLPSSLRALAKQSHIMLCVMIFTLLSSCQDNSNSTIQTTKNSSPTFVEIAPIIFKNCTPCHRAGESGPIELMTYENVYKNKNKIKFVTQTKYMPPWPADPSYTHFVGERTLTPEEIDLIKTCVFSKIPKINHAFFK